MYAAEFMSDDRVDRLVLRVPVDSPTLDGSLATDVFVDARRGTEADLRALSRLGSLETLELSGNPAPLASLADLPRLRRLRLTDPGTLQGLENVRQIETLALYYLPRILSLAPLSALKHLRSLLISTPPGYDASRRCHRVESLWPLGQLQHLRRLVLRGILPDTDGLKPLRSLRQLVEIEITHVYAFSLDDYARLARALPHTRGHCVQPYFEAPWAGQCVRCGGPRVVLTGPPPRSPRFVCPGCGERRLRQHVQKWTAAMTQP